VPPVKTLDAHACWNHVVTADSSSPAVSITVKLWSPFGFLHCVVTKCSNVLEENISSTFMAIGFVGVNAKMTQRKNFVGYVEQFEIVLSIIAMMVVGGGRTVLIQWYIRMQ